jgi:hypothetical protein
MFYYIRCCAVRLASGLSHLPCGAGLNRVTYSSPQHLKSQFQATRRLVIALSLFITQAFGTTYYVSSSTGSDSNSGTSTSSPWKTITKVAGRSYTPGDFILLKKGDTWIGSNFSRTLTTLSKGLSGNPITYGSYGTGGTPVLDGKGSLSIAINITKDFVTVTGLAIRNVTSALIRVNASNVSVTNNKLLNSHNSAVQIQSGTNNLVDNNQYSTAANWSQQNDTYSARTLGSAKFTHNTCDLRNVTSGSATCFSVWGSSTSTMQYNFVYGGSQGYSFKPVGGGKCLGPNQTGGLIADNYAEGVSSVNGDGEAIELTGCSGHPQRGIVVARNVLICKGGGAHHGTIDAIGSFYSSNAVIQGNVIIGDCGAYPVTNAPNLMHFSSHSTGLSVYNNTMYGSGRSDQVAINVLPGSSVNAKNNIMGHLGKGIYNQGGSASEDYNIYMANVRTPYSRTSSGGHSKKSTNPLFVVASPTKANDVKLQATSPAIHKGTNLGSAYSLILHPSATTSPYAAFDQSIAGWMIGAFGYAFPAATPIQSGWTNVRP